MKKLILMLLIATSLFAQYTGYGGDKSYFRAIGDSVFLVTGKTKLYIPQMYVGTLHSTGAVEYDGTVTFNEGVIFNDTINVVTIVSGTITGKSQIHLVTAATVVFTTIDSCKNHIWFNNDADIIDFTLPGAEAGLAVMFYDIAGGVITIDPVDETDTIYLDGTSVGAGDAIDSPGAVGNFIVLIAIDATRWVTVGRSGTWVDGGAN